MLENKTGDMTPFDMSKPPKKQYPFLLPVIWAGSFVMTRQFGLKIYKKNMKGLKPPFLVFSTHQGFSDYYIAPLALFPHRANYVSDMEGFAAFGEWLYRGIGCIGKRRYVPDITVMKNIKAALDSGQSVVIFPESRHSNVGTTAYLPDNLGRLAKLLNVPVVTLSVHGSYLANPFWDEEHTRKVPMEAMLECICTQKELLQRSDEELQQRIEQKLQYDEYAWQQEQNIRITYPKRAEGLHKALYHCRECGTRYQMESEGCRLYCKACGAEWVLTEDGWLQPGGEECAREAVLHKNKGKLHIPDWYEWQRSMVMEELENRYRKKSDVAGADKELAEDDYNQDESIRKFFVRVEALANSKGFVSLGKGVLRLNTKGFQLLLAAGELFFAHATRESVQTEYNYRGRGPCIVLSDKDCCYYIYSEDEGFNPTELQFIGESFFGG